MNRTQKQRGTTYFPCTKKCRALKAHNACPRFSLLKPLLRSSFSKTAPGLQPSHRRAQLAPTAASLNRLPVKALPFLAFSI